MKKEKGDIDASARLWLAQPTAREARSGAVFASALRPSGTPAAGMIASAISRAVQRLGTRGCAEKMAQEFGDHPDVAAGRMRWARQLAAWPVHAQDRLHGTQDRAASRSGTRAASQHPKEARKALAVIAAARLMAALDATIVPSTRPPSQRSNEQSGVHLGHVPGTRPVVLVIGARGALGALVADAFRRHGWAVRQSSRDPIPPPDFHYVDLTDPATLAPALDGADLVITTVPDPTLAAERHVLRRGGVLLNLSAGPATALRSLRREAGQAKGTVVMNAGIAPGVTNLLAAQLLDDRLVVGQGDFRMAASSGIVFAGALLGRDGRVSAQPGAWYPEEVSLNRVEASLRRAGIDVTKTGHDRAGSASVR